MTPYHCISIDPDHRGEVYLVDSVDEETAPTTPLQAAQVFARRLMRSYSFDVGDTVVVEVRYVVGSGLHEQIYSHRYELALTERWEVVG